MSSAVHIAVHGEDHIPVVLYLKDADIMLFIYIPDIECAVIIEAVDAGELAGLFAVGKEPASGYEGNGAAVGTLHHLGAFVSYAEGDLVVDTHIQGIGYLFHGPDIGHDIYGLVGIPYYHVFVGHVCGEVAAVAVAEHVLDAYGGIGTVVLLEVDKRLSVGGHFKVAVCDLVEG